MTVRGVGPDFNLVLLNGRQMPASSIATPAASNSRAFDFANLASESITAVEVFKTSRAPPARRAVSAPPSTSRPRVRSRLRRHDRQRRRQGRVRHVERATCRSRSQGSSLTPEISGIFSNTFADGKFGVALTGSYQERDLGYSQAAVVERLALRSAATRTTGATIPLPGAPGSENITNRPGPDDIYSVPQNLNYSVNGVQRKRTNGQLTLQYAPSDR